MLWLTWLEFWFAVSVQISLTVYGPAAVYVWSAVAVGAVLSATAPSPKSKWYVPIGVASLSVDVEPSARTVSAGLASCETVSRATGALSGGGGAAATVMLWLTWVELWFAVSVQVSLTV